MFAYIYNFFVVFFYFTRRRVASGKELDRPGGYGRFDFGNKLDYKAGDFGLRKACLVGGNQVDDLLDVVYGDKFDWIGRRCVVDLGDDQPHALLRVHNLV